jgi:hypothetical protein
MRFPKLVLLFCAVFPLAALADAPADFSGDWVATGNNSADASQPSSGDTPRAGGHSGGHGGGGNGGGGHGGMGGGHHGRQTAGGSNDSSSTASASTPGDPRLNAHALIIRQSDVVFDVDADGQRMAYRFDNRNNYGAPYGGTVTLTWAVPELVIETHPDGGGSIEEHYSLSADGKTLTLLTREQRAGEDSVRENRRTFVRNDDAANALP